MHPPTGAFFRAVPNGIVGPEIIGVPGPKFFPGVFVTDRFILGWSLRERGGRPAGSGRGGRPAGSGRAAKIRNPVIKWFS